MRETSVAVQLELRNVSDKRADEGYDNGSPQGST